MRKKVKSIDGVGIYSGDYSKKGLSHFLLQLLGVVIVASVAAWVIIGVTVGI